MLDRVHMNNVETGIRSDRFSCRDDVLDVHSARTALQELRGSAVDDHYGWTELGDHSFNFWSIDVVASKVDSVLCMLEYKYRYGATFFPISPVPCWPTALES